VFIFCRLKINHESHEFILDPGTVANNSNQKGTLPTKGGLFWKNLTFSDVLVRYFKHQCSIFCPSVTKPAGGHRAKASAAAVFVSNFSRKIIHLVVYTKYTCNYSLAEYFCKK
jgi:hypothetical protein